MDLQIITACFKANLHQLNPTVGSRERMRRHALCYQFPHTFFTVFSIRASHVLHLNFLRFLSKSNSFLLNGQEEFLASVSKHWNRYLRLRLFHPSIDWWLYASLVVVPLLCIVCFIFVFNSVLNNKETY